MKFWPKIPYKLYLDFNWKCTFYPCRSAAKAEFKLRGYAPQVRRMDIGVNWGFIFGLKLRGKRLEVPGSRGPVTWFLFTDFSAAGSGIWITSSRAANVYTLRRQNDWRAYSEKDAGFPRTFQSSSKVMYRSIVLADLWPEHFLTSVNDSADLHLCDNGVIELLSDLP